MRQCVAYLLCLCIVLEHVIGDPHRNETLPDAVSRQLPDFRRQHPVPIGVMTRHTGEPLDIRDTVTLNSDIFNNRNFFRFTAHVDRERLPERIVHGKGYGAFGYFQVTHDVSNYTKADVFNGIGKKTPVVVRFSTNREKLGGNDVSRDARAMALKMYTRQGNLDLIGFHTRIFFYKDPINFGMNGHVGRRNPRTSLFDTMMRWDFISLRPELLHLNLWIASDLGIPDGYRKSSYYPVHTYEIYNKHGERYFVKFNFETEIGLYNLTNAEAMVLRAEDPDYFNRDLYNAIANKHYPSWRLSLDIMKKEDLTKWDYDPFDVTTIWKKGTYTTVPVGRLVLNRNAINQFKDTEQGAYSPDNLVPGITGPHDVVFRSRKLFYPDTQNYRLGVNHDNIQVNAPYYAKTYNRDGAAPALDNMRDAPNYYPNSFNGPMPYVDEDRPKDVPVILHSNTIDLQPHADFYNEILESDEHRQRVAENIASAIVAATPDVENRVIWLLSLISPDFGRRVKAALHTLRRIPAHARREQITQCFTNTNRYHKNRFQIP